MFFKYTHNIYLQYSLNIPRWECFKRRASTRGRSARHFCLLRLSGGWCVWRSVGLCHWVRVSIQAAVTSDYPDLFLESCIEVVLRSIHYCTCEWVGVYLELSWQRRCRPWAGNGMTNSNTTCSPYISFTTNVNSMILWSFCPWSCDFGLWSCDLCMCSCEFFFGGLTGGDDMFSSKKFRLVVICVHWCWKYICSFYQYAFQIGTKLFEVRMWLASGGNFMGVSREHSRVSREHPRVSREHPKCTMGASRGHQVV